MDTIDPVPPPGTTPVDVEAFREEMREAGVESVVPRILATFAGDLPDQEAALRRAMESGDPAAVASRAHGLKSASGSVHAYRLQALLGALESRARELGTDACGELAEETFTEIGRVRAHLETVNTTSS